MPAIPATEHPALIRTDFTEPRIWKSICRLARGKEFDEEYDDPIVSFVDDPAFKGFTTDQVIRAAAKEYGHSYIMIVDSIATHETGRPVLFVDLKAPELQFRTIASECETTIINFHIGNLSFDDYIFSVGKGGTYRPKRKRKSAED